MEEPKKKKKPRAFTLTPRELALVGAYEGSISAAARAIKMDIKNAQKLAVRPRVWAAMQKKIDAATIECGKQLGRKIAKYEVLERALRLADIKPKETNGSILGQVKSLELVAKVEGWLTDSATPPPPPPPSGPLIYGELRRTSVQRVTETLTQTEAIPTLPPADFEIMDYAPPK